jgi:hypothetical protein
MRPDGKRSNNGGNEMSQSTASYEGTPNGFTFGARKFKPYRGKDVKQGKGGYVQIRGIWATLHESGSVELLGWGNTNGGELSEYTETEQAELKKTL